MKKLIVEKTTPPSTAIEINGMKLKEIIAQSKKHLVSFVIPKRERYELFKKNLTFKK